jgi:branched-chain amino acid transport system permease protein
VTAAIRSLPRSFFAQHSWRDIVAIRIPLLLLLALPLFAPTLFASSRLLSLAVTAAIYVIVANGLHVVFSYAGQLSLAHSTLWGVGAYTTALLIEHYGWPTYALIPIAGLVAASMAVAIGIPAFRTAGFSFAIITFAFAEILILIANNWTELTHGSVGITISEPPTPIGPIEFDTFDNLNNFYYLVLAFAYLSVLAVVLIHHSALGRNFIAIRENEPLARSLGLNAYLFKLIAFGLSGFLAGVGGVFLMYQRQHIDPTPLSPFTAFFTIQFLLIILIGGRFSILGPAIGAVVVVFSAELLEQVFGIFSDELITAERIQMFFGATLALSVIWAPSGITGQAKRNFGVIARFADRTFGAGRSVPTESTGDSQQAQ